MTATKTSSWGHKLTPLPERRTSAYTNRDNQDWCSNRKRCPGAWEDTYHVGAGFTICDGPDPKTGEGHKTTRGAKALFWASWSYVTGRGGRVSRADRKYCQPCAERFAANHGLTMPDGERTLIQRHTPDGANHG